jgi:6-phosphofructokinase
MVVEVLGRDSGFLAVISAIAGGAGAVMVPEFETRPPYACRSALRASLLGACTLGASETSPKRITR